MEKIEKVLTKEIILPIVAIIVSFIIYVTLKKIIKRFLSSSRINHRKHETIISLFTNLVKYTLIVICGLLVLEAFGVETKNIVASLGILGLVIGLSLQDILKDFVAGMFIILENQYAVGDHITVGGYSGQVISFGLKTTKIAAYNGEVKTIPNRYVDQSINNSIKNPIITIDIPISSDYDVIKIKAFFEKICLELTDELKNIKGQVEFVGLSAMAANGATLDYRIRVEVKHLKVEETKNIIFTKIVTSLKANKEELLSKEEN
ncbi:MAG: mechanosensitive ion channel [Bacilli bacterium]|nr:mechanosensitive ion channel [Bacilli bacterium]